MSAPVLAARAAAKRSISVCFPPRISNSIKNPGVTGTGRSEYMLIYNRTFVLIRIYFLDVK
jgi:hypothetical protein